MKSVTILGARFDADLGRIEIIKSIVNDDDTVDLNLHSISTDTLEWKAADIGTDDLDVLIDAIVYEPFVDSDSSEPFIGQVQRLKREKTSTSTNKGQAREKLTKAGVDQKYLDAVDNDYRRVIVDHCHFDSEVIALKANHMREQKELIKNESAPRSRVDMIGAQLTPSSGIDKDSRR